MDSSSWWQVDHNHDPPLTQGATPLLKICMETYGWKEEKAHRILTGYKQFLELKKKLGDFDGTILEPSNVIDQMWVQHYGSRNYNKDCQLLCDNVVKRDGYGRLDSESRKRRIAATAPVLKSVFKTLVDEEIWSFAGHNHSLVPVSKEGEEETSIIFRPHWRPVLHEASYDFSLSTCFIAVACIYAEDQGKEYRDLRFVVDGHEVGPGESLRELGFANNQVVDVMKRKEAD